MSATLFALVSNHAFRLQNVDDETDDEGAEQPEPIIYENSDDEESEDAVDAEEEEGTDTEGLGDVTDAHESDESDVMQE